MCSRNSQRCSKTGEERPGKPAVKQGGWTRRSQEVPYNLNDSVISSLTDDRLLSLLLYF